MSEKPFVCKECGKISSSSACPFGEEYLNNEIEDEFFEGGYLCWYAFCSYSHAEILMRIPEDELDCSNTAAKLNEWAIKEKLAVRFDWGEVETGNPGRGGGWAYRDAVIAILGDETIVLRASTYSACIKAVRKLLTEEGQE